MIDLPPPPQPMEKEPVEIVQEAEVFDSDLSDLEYEITFEDSSEASEEMVECEEAFRTTGCICECKAEGEGEEKTFAEDEDLMFYAKELRSVFDDGFQWGDLSTITRLSIEFMNQFVDMTEKEKRDAVVSIVEYLIDITDTPYLPDFITDPIMKALVPPFVDLMISVTKGEVWTKGADRYGRNETMATPEQVNEFSEGLLPLIQGDFAWSNFFQAFEDSLEFFCSYIDISQETQKDAIYGVLAFIIDVTSWPFFLDPILDPILKAILPPVIDLIFDQVAG